MKFSLTVLALATAAVAMEHAPRDYDYKKNGTVYTTITVNELVTYCPEPTHVTQHGKVYTMTKAGHLTITDCPCTIVEPVYAPKTILYTSCEGDDDKKKEHKETKHDVYTKTVDGHDNKGGKETKVIDTYTKTHEAAGQKTHEVAGHKNKDDGEYKHYPTGAPHPGDDGKKQDKEYKEYTGAAADSVRVGSGLFAGVLAVLGLVL